jgi:hypothetical protein
MIRDLVTYAKTYKDYTGEHGLYVSRVPDVFSVDKIVNLVHTSGLCTMDDKDISQLHCTIMYSPNPVRPDNGVEGMDRNDMHPVNLVCSAWVVRVEFWPGHDEEGYLVACLESKALHSIHRLWKLRGGVPTFPEYKPHITLKTPFEEYRGLTHKLKLVNSFLATEPLLIRLEKETVEDIKSKSFAEVSVLTACGLTEED